MLVKKKVSTLRKGILTALLVISMGLIFYLLYSNFGSNSPVVRSQGINVKKLNVSDIDTNFDSSYFNKSPYKDLIQYGQLPVTVQGTGRSDPFSELPFYVVQQPESVDEDEQEDVEQ